jgi:hypothetical protein
MKLYNVHILETGEELCVAARSADHAAEVIVTFWFARTGSAPGRFDVQAGAPPAYSENSFVRLVADGELAGVIIRQLDGSMIFEAAGS